MIQITHNPFLEENIFQIELWYQPMNASDITSENGIDRVIFLGAGASVDDGAPGQSELLPKFCRIIAEDSDSSRNKNLKNFLTRFFGVDDFKNIDDTKFPRCEEILSLLGIPESLEEPYSDYCSEDLRELEKTLVYGISEVLKRELESPERSTKAGTYNDRLVKRLVGNRNKPNGSSSIVFISTNYDILVDNAILEQGKSIDYGFSFSNDSDQYSSGEVDKIPLLKLHGSLNWLFCPNCERITCTDFVKRGAKLLEEPKPCHSCNTEMKLVVVPPTFLKSYTNRYLKQVWNKARDILSQANRIDFSGYSLPLADIHIKHLLKQGEMNRRGDLPKIYVMNHHEGKSDSKIVQEYDRFTRLLKSDIKYTKMSFQEYSQSVRPKSESSQEDSERIDVFSAQEIDQKRMRINSN